MFSLLTYYCVFRGKTAQMSEIILHFISIFSSNILMIIKVACSLCHCLLMLKEQHGKKNTFRLWRWREEGEDDVREVMVCAAW